MSRILIVDDEPGFAALLGQALSLRGHDVRSCETAAEALPLIPALVPEIVVLDWMLPGTERDRVLAAVMQVASNARIIVVTGLQASQIVWLVPPPAEWEVLEKPFSVDALLDAVDRKP
jgi:two-component system, NtrC family, C4-dicarboxylate transport response regulator DctD